MEQETGLWRCVGTWTYLVWQQCGAVTRHEESRVVLGMAHNDGAQAKAFPNVRGYTLGSHMARLTFPADVTLYSLAADGCLGTEVEPEQLGRCFRGLCKKYALKTRKQWLCLTHSTTICCGPAVCQAVAGPEAAAVSRRPRSLPSRCLHSSGDRL